jgi:N utilization substance protein B
MQDRRIARRLALDVLYEAEIRDMLPEDAFLRRQSEGWVIPAPGDRGPDEEAPALGPAVEESPSAEALDYALQLVRGVQQHQADADVLIARYADRWAIQRMPVIDRTLVRMALYELLWREDIPIPVAINEAVELAKDLSTDDSGRFVNGLLGKIVEQEATDQPADAPE